MIQLEQASFLVDPKLYDQKVIDEYAKRYELDPKEQPSLGEILRAKGDNE
jgi:hypothetical protein